MSSENFLVEIGTEELPPKALLSLSNAFTEGVIAELQRAGLSHGDIASFATPRRIAVLVRDLQTKQNDSTHQKVGPAVKAAFDSEGKPTKAAEGFARSCGVDVEQLTEVDIEGVTKLSYTISIKGQQSIGILPDIVNNSLNKLPIPKRMRWGSTREEFVRPVHWVVMLLGSEVVPATILGIQSGNKTGGHRFHNNVELALSEPTDYEQVLENDGKVIPDFNKRRELIRQQVLDAAAAINAEVEIDEDLLNEVTSLVELPVALTGKFDESFLSVPAEALILAMKSHQKCFCLTDADGKLKPYFITISNLMSNDPGQVVEGNERVIRPRLADAQFFYDTDRQQPLASRLEKLKSIVFQDKLGSVYAKSERVSKLATYIAEELGIPSEYCQRAALLAKCDLVTNMVGEFADLQGLMGAYYAEHDGEPIEVVKAIPEQYLPRFAGDQLPATPAGSVLALAEKLDTIAGLFAIGQPPTGSKDPFALRRAAIGVLRILVEKQLDLDLEAVIKRALAEFTDLKIADGVATQIFDFMLERFRAWYQEEKIPVEVFLSVQAVKPVRPLDFHQRIKAVQKFAGLPEAASLAAANKRVSNILDKQAGAIASAVDSNLLSEAAEKALYEAVTAQQPKAERLFGKRSYTEGLAGLAGLKDSVDTFFDEVMVMCDDEKVRANRLALLQQLRNLFLHAADISHLHQN